jgi:ubiquinone/menaquinone biosynthesis C-methylase UbiE
VSDYNLDELKIARDPTNPRHILPPRLSPSSRVLDIGCGAGQSLIAAYQDRVSFGIDMDLHALALGRSLTDRIWFANGRAEALPFKSGQFDLVFARVSLPYTHIPISLREIHRVLKKGGMVWLTLHPFSIAWRQVQTSNYRGKLFFAYIMLNSLCLHLFQWQFSFLGRQESFQTERSIRRALEQNAFEDVSVAQGDPSW